MFTFITAKRDLKLTQQWGIYLAYKTRAAARAQGTYAKPVLVISSWYADGASLTSS